MVRLKSRELATIYHENGLFQFHYGSIKIRCSVNVHID